MKTCLLAIALLLLPGCTSMSKVVEALGKDPATAHLRVTTIYGTIEVSRTNPQTNTIPHSVSDTGAITVAAPAPTTTILQLAPPAVVTTNAPSPVP